MFSQGGLRACKFAILMRNMLSYSQLHPVTHSYHSNILVVTLYLKLASVSVLCVRLRILTLQREVGAPELHTFASLACRFHAAPVRIITQVRPAQRCACRRVRFYRRPDFFFVGLFSRGGTQAPMTRDEVVYGLLGRLGLLRPKRVGLSGSNPSERQGRPGTRFHPGGG